MSTLLAVVVRLAVIAVGLWIATVVVPGIDYAATGTAARIGTLLGVAVIFTLIDVTLKRLIKVVGFLFYVLTLGLIGLVVNALLFMLVGYLAATLGLGFTVGGFGAAFLGAIVVSIVSVVAHLVVPDRIDRR